MKYTTTELSSERLTMRRGTLDDYVKVYEYDFRHLRDICGDFEFVKQDPKNLIGFETYADEDDAMDWIIFLKPSDTPVGNIIADRPDPVSNSVELSFNLHPSYWGNEYMKEAAVCIMRHLFEIGFANVLCGYSEGNRKSKRLCEKLGFEPYRINENAWQKNGQSVTDYLLILSEDRFYKLFGKADN